MGKVISLAERRQSKKESLQTLPPLPGILVWLHCPKCDTKQYSELRLPQGRYYKCGTMVKEVEVPIDVRAEYTISQRNTEQLAQWFETVGKSHPQAATLKQMTAQLLEGEQQYQQKLGLIAHAAIDPYPDSWQPERAELDLEEALPWMIQFTAARRPEDVFRDKKSR